MRLRWMLKDAGAAADAKAIDGYLTKLAGASSAGNRDELKTLVTAMGGDKAQAEKISAGLKTYYDEMNALPPAARKLAEDAANDLSQTLGDIPDPSLAADWAYLCNEMRQGPCARAGKNPGAAGYASPPFAQCK